MHRFRLVCEKLNIVIQLCPSTNIAIGINPQTTLWVYIEIAREKSLQRMWTERVPAKGMGGERINRKTETHNLRLQDARKNGA